MGVKRIVDTDFWKDEKVIDEYSPEDKYFWLYLLTNPQTKQLGVYKLPKRIIAFETGYSLDTVKVLLERFQHKYKTIIYSDDTQEIAILNYLKYSIIKGGKPVMDCIIKDIGQVKNTSLLKMVYKKIINLKDERDTIKKIQEMLSVYNTNDNDNDNDNDRYVPRIVPRIVEDEKNIEISTNKKVKKDTPQKDIYGEFEKVKLTSIEFNKLLEKLGQAETKEMIDRLDAYKASSGKIYASDYATILNWNRKDAVEGKQQVKPQKQPKQNSFHNFAPGESKSEAELEEMARKKIEKKLAEIKEAKGDKLNES